jgi:PTS system mannose-specific IIA component
MTGIVIATHANLGQALIDTVEFILGSKVDRIAFVSIDIKEQVETLHKKIKKGIKAVQQGEDGVIIFTDMHGGTPSNLSYSFLEEGSVEVISGVNLPILLKAISLRDKMELEKAVSTLVEHGRKSISLASGILKGTGGD